MMCPVCSCQPLLVFSKDCPECPVPESCFTLIIFLQVTLPLSRSQLFALIYITFVITCPFVHPSRGTSPFRILSLRFSVSVLYYLLIIFSPGQLFNFAPSRPNSSTGPGLLSKERPVCNYSNDVRQYCVRECEGMLVLVKLTEGLRFSKFVTRFRYHSLNPYFYFISAIFTLKEQFLKILV